MLFNQTNATGTPSYIPARDYPPPPRIHWLVLAFVFTGVKLLIAHCAPLRYHELFDSLAVDAWAFYLCLWIRSLDSDARSPFWCDVYVIVELAYAALDTRQNPSPIINSTLVLLALASVVLGLVTIFLIRSDLVRHYNEREPYGLQLSGAMTLFFSFLYFQYHLYDIAKRREQDRAAHPGSLTFS